MVQEKRNSFFAHATRLFFLCRAQIRRISNLRLIRIMFECHGTLISHSPVLQYVFNSGRISDMPVIKSGREMSQYCQWVAFRCGATPRRLTALPAFIRKSQFNQSKFAASHVKSSASYLLKTIILTISWVLAALNIGIPEFQIAVSPNQIIFQGAHI
ncbi:protein of unknown function [Paraburkholderia dioscoreae]|uniref:Uncharacterized protein n=1 Tax=Paraburkholderia dioscoreae TaxID=2604047 RepID=A0A5Q4YXF1_9BURK|nr:protein of unknown function [Paraburkholderia dioscoreae]